MMVAFQHITFFSINCLVEPNKSVTHIYPSKFLYKGDCSASGAWLLADRFKHLQGAFKALCRCFFACV